MDGNRNSYKKTLSKEEQHTADEISIEQLQHLVSLLDKSEVSEIEVKQADLGTRLVLRKAKASESNTISVAVPPPASAEEASHSSGEAKHTVAAPLVGIFHSWAKPQGTRLVSVGDRVKIGQRIGTIQSLNVLNEVESLVAGRVAEIVVEDGQAVEYGQPLIIIDGIEEA